MQEIIEITQELRIKEVTRLTVDRRCALNRGNLPTRLNLNLRLLMVTLNRLTLHLAQGHHLRVRKLVRTRLQREGEFRFAISPLTQGINFVLRTEEER